MAYEKQTFINKSTVLTAEHLNHIEQGIVDVENAVDNAQTTANEAKTGLESKAPTNHGNHVPETETANNAKFLRNDNTWQIVTPTNIGARPDDWLPSPDDIGAISAVSTSLVNISVKEWAQSLSCSAYAFTDNTTKDMPIEVAPGDSFAIATATVVAGGAWIELKLTYVVTGCVAVVIYNYGWSEWKWEVPPMALDTEYLTTERWNGYPVYIKLINVGALPNNSTKSVQVFDNAAGGRVIEAYGFETRSGQKIPSMRFGGDWSHNVELPFSGRTLNLNTNFDGSEFTSAHITVKYIKY